MNSNPQGRGSQFAREARMGLTIIAVLAVVFVWVAYRRFSTSSDPIADLRSEAMERQASRMEELIGSPENQIASQGSGMRVPSSDRSGSAPAVGVATRAYGDNPAQSPAFQLDRSKSSAPASSNPAFSNPAHSQSLGQSLGQSREQSRGQVASSFYNRENDSTAPSKAFPRQSEGGGSDFSPKTSLAQNKQPKASADSSDDSLDEPVIEFGNEASADEVGEVGEVGEPNSAPQIPAQDSLVKSEKPDSMPQTAGRANNFSENPNSVQTDNVTSAKQMPAVHQGKARGIAAEMVSTTLNKTQTFVVQKNDTFWSISQRAYGTGHYFKALYEYNKGHLQNPDNLPLGQKIVAPPISTLRAKFPHLTRQNESVNQTSFQQGDDTPAIDPQSADEQIVPELRPIRTIDPGPPIQRTSETDFVPNFSVQPNPLPRQRLSAPAEPVAMEASQPAAQAEPEVPQASVADTGEKPANLPVDLYVVREGDNLFNIARNELLQASRYLDILRLNRDDLPADCTHLTPLPAGLKLRLPGR